MPNANTSLDRLMGSDSPAQGTKSMRSLATSDTNAHIILDATGGAATAQFNASQLAATAYASGQDGFAFRVRVVGRVTTGGSATVTIAILNQSSTTYTSGNVIATGNRTSLNGSDNFIVEATCLWDSTSKNLRGYQNGIVGATIISAATLTNALAPATISALQFNIAVTVSTSTATFYISEFVIDTV